MEDRHLVARAQAGDHRAFGQLRWRYNAMIRSIIRDYYAAGLDRQDFEQEASLGLWNAVRNYNVAAPTSSFGNFAHLCITRQVITALKAAHRDKHRAVNTAMSFNAPVSTRRQDHAEATFEEVLTDGSEPHDLLDVRDDAHLVFRVLAAAASETERRAGELRMAGVGYEDIARELGLPAKTVDNALQRLRRKIARAQADPEWLDSIGLPIGWVPFLADPMPRREPCDTPRMSEGHDATAFARGVMERGLDEMRTRLARLEPMIAEADTLRKAIRAQEGALEKVAGSRPRTAAAQPRQIAGAAAPAPPPAGDGEGAPNSLTASDKLLLAMADKPEGESLAELAKRTGIVYQTAANRMQGLVARSVAQRVGRGFYRLTQRGEEEVAHIREEHVVDEAA